MSYNNRHTQFPDQRANGFNRSRAPEEHRQSFEHSLNHQQHGHLQNVNYDVFNDRRPKPPDGLPQSHPVHQQHHGFRQSGNYGFNESRPRAPDEMTRSGASALFVDRRVHDPAARPIVQISDNQRRFLHDRNPPIQQMPPQHGFRPKPQQQPPVPLNIREDRSRNDSNEENITPPATAVSSISPELNTGISETKFYRIKLEIPASLSELHRNQVKNKLFEALNKTVPPLSSEEYNEPGCVSFIETTYEIPYSGFLSGPSLFKSLSNFTANVSNAVTVKTCDPALLSQNLVAEHTGLHLQCLRFGNINDEGKFLSHFEVAYNFNHYRNESMKKKFTANFQYGNKRICFIELWNFEKYHQLFARYFVTCDRDHISRIMVSVRENSPIRLILELTCPPFIKKRNQLTQEEIEKDFHDKEPNFRCFTINRVIENNGYPADGELADSRFLMLEFDKTLSEHTLHELLSRLNFRTGRPIEFVSMQISDCFLGKFSPYLPWVQDYRPRLTQNTQRKTRPQGKKLKSSDEENPTIVAFGAKDKFYNDLLNEKLPATGRAPPENKRKRFILTYHLEALVARGAVVKDRLLLDEKIYGYFVKQIVSFAAAEFDECIRLLEAMILFVETRSRLKNMAFVFSDLYKSMKSQELSALLPPQELTNGYQRVLSVVCTPSRVILKPAELQMGNRVTRNYDSDGTEVIRVTFRDDDGNFMRENIIGKRNMKACVHDRMVRGIRIAGRTYTFFGSSGSQQRDQGAYFMVKEKVEETLNKLGDFNKIENMHKRLAREGQCLTQSRECNVPIRRWKLESDIKGGRDRYGKPYLFTDGAGRMSVDFAKKIAESHGLSHYVPSAVQFRFGGKKGLLVTDPHLDEERKWAEQNCPDELEKYDYDIIFRDSQHKFEGEEINQLEIVKFSMPQPTNLSRPLINIIDQVTGMQSKETQKTSGDRIEDLQENVFLNFADAAVDENKFRNVLDGLPYLINIDYLSEAKGFQLHREPFFMKLETAKTRYDIRKKLSNQTIPIPVNLGRSMFGVPDSSEQLQYNQIFIQITKSVNDKFPSESAATEIITGPVLVTKNPALAEGDVRVFMAVDIPQLRHLRDVMVFSVHGERWNCDEMAGSDADGDEYTGIWDKRLLLNHNQPAFDFASDNKTTELEPANSMEEQRANACYDLFTNNVIGLCSDAHLVSSDLYGINSPTTISLTSKVTTALDFGKSGNVPDPMTSEWTKDPKTGKMIPPEKIERRPDFKGATFQPTYASARLNGRLHRMNKKAANVISMDPLNETITVNSVFSKKAWNEITDRLGNEAKNKIMDDARKVFSGYVARMRAILDNYGVKTEAEALTGCFLEMKNKFAEREEDSGSMYTTGSMVLQLAMDVFVEARKMFFEEFGGWRQVTSCGDMYHEEEVSRRICCVSSDELHAKALAYYKVCYESPSEQKEFLSFAWLAFDVLANVQQNYLANHPEEIPDEDSFFKKLAVDVTKLVKGKKESEFLAFSKRANHKPFILPFLGSYGKHYTGIRATWFVLVEWAKMCGVLKNGLTEDHLLLIFIALGTQTIVTGDQPFMEILPKSFNYHKENCVTLEKGKAIVQLLRAMASRKFGRQASLDFTILGAKMTLSKGEWIPLHDAARKSFYSLMINQRIEELLFSPANLEVKEWEPRVIELPDDADLHLLTTKLRALTGAESILLRRMNPNFPGLVTAFIRGNLESEERFQQATQLKAEVYADLEKKKISELTRLNYAKILRHQH